MTVREIYALRRAGQLQEALEAAEAAFANNADRYTASALFWCLNDLVKQQGVANSAETIERMKSLYTDYCDGDEYMQRSLNTFTHQSLLHYQDIRDANEKARAGNNILTEYRTIEDAFKAGQLDASLFQDFGWLTYYALRQVPSSDSNRRKELLNNYMRLNLPKPSQLHSCILNEAIKVEKDTPLQFRVRDFIQMWGLENLREEDWAQYKTNEGIDLPSSVERLVSVYAKELKTDGVAAPEEFSRLVDQALVRYPNNQYMPYYKATVLISQGRRDDALDFYKDLILRFPSRFYLWRQISQLVEDADTRIGLLCKALTCGADDEFLGNVRLDLVPLLIQKDLMPNAKYELEKYRSTYQSKGWGLKPEFWQIYNQLARSEPADNNSAVYAEFAAKADEFVYSALPTVVAVKISDSQTEDRHHPGRKISVWNLRVEKSVVRLNKPHKFGLNRRTPNGSAFDVRILEGRIVWIKEHSGPVNVPWLKEQSGVARTRTDKNGKRYAIISGSYVNEKLLNGISDGQQIKILSVLQKDGRWSAISASVIPE